MNRKIGLIEQIRNDPRIAYLEENASDRSPYGWMRDREGTYSAEYPDEYEYMRGWHSLIIDALIKIAQIDKERKMSIAQIKIKFGGLRLYIDGIKDNMKVFDITNEAEHKASLTCIHCGKVIDNKLKNQLCNICTKELKK